MSQVPHGGPAGGDEVLRSEALVEDTGAAPRRRAGVGFIAAFTFAYLGFWIAFLTPPIVAMAIRIAEVVPEGQRAGSLALVLGVGGLFSIFANPFFGRLSDRTTSRFGMRKPWMVGGVVVGALGLLVVATVQSVPLLLVGWCVAVTGLNALFAALVALLPDQVPEGQRGRVSGILGMGLPVGAVGGAFLAQAFSGTTFLMFMAPAFIALVAVAILLAVFNDRKGDPAHRPPRYSGREFLSSFYVSPRRYPDFAWAWLSRFLLFMAVATLVTYQAFYLTDHLGIPIGQVAGLVAVSTLIHYVFVVLFSVVSGWVSDRAGRRKVFVLGAALVYAVGLVFVAFAGSFEVFLVGMAITGIGEGIYLAVDLALVTDVLPHPDDAAKDLGVFSVANLLPTALAPAIAPIFLAIPFFARGTGGNYVALFFVAAVFALVGAIAIRPVRGVR